MNAKGYLIISVILACFISSILSYSVYAKPSEKESVQQICNQLFGSPVDEELNLFEVNQFYVLSVKFNSRGNLEELAVEPKYFFDEKHPEWKELNNFAYLSKAEYENLLARLDRIKPKGMLIKPSSGGGVVTNMTLHHKEIYRQAVVICGELVDIRRGENAEIKVRWFRLKYIKAKSS